MYKLLRRASRLLWRVARESWRRDRYAFRDLGRTLAYWTGDRPPHAARMSRRTTAGKTTQARRYKVKAHTRRDGTKVKAHWRVK